MNDYPMLAIWHEQLAKRDAGLTLVILLAAVVLIWACVGRWSVPAVERFLHKFGAWIWLGSLVVAWAAWALRTA